MRLVQEIYKDHVSFLKNTMRLAYKTIGEYNLLLFNLIKPARLLRPALGSKYAEEKIDGIQSKASNYLSKLYSLSKGDQSRQFDIYEIGKKLGYEASETESIVENLSRSELIRNEKASSKVANFSISNLLIFL